MFKWHTYPFVRLLIPLLLGIIAARYVELSENNFNLLISITSLSIAIGLILNTRLKKPSHVSLLTFLQSALLVALGFILVFLKDETHRNDYFGKIFFENNDANSNALFLATINDVTITASNTRLNVAVNYLSGAIDAPVAPEIKKVSGNLLLYTPLDSTQKFNIGDKIAVNCTPQPITSLNNPFDFNFAAYWHFKNVHAQCFVKSDAIKIIDEPIKNTIQTLSAKLQARLSDLLAPYLPTPNEYYVGTALILGAKSSVAEEIKTAYIQTGAMHILAVSGMHVVLLWAALKGIVGIFIKSRNSKTIIGNTLGILFIWVFACVTGLGASVLRATVMATFLGVGELTFRKTNAFNLLAASAFTLLIFDPNMLFDIGFQFSYLAVLSIVVWYKFIFSWVSSKNKIVLFFWEITALGFAAQILVTPLSLYYFHRFPTYFWLTGLLAIPVSTVALYAGLLVFIFQPVAPLAWCAGQIFHGSIWLMNFIIQTTNTLPFNNLDGIYLSGFTVFSMYLIVYFVFRALYKKRLRAWYPVLLSILAVTSLSAIQFQNKTNCTICVYNTPKKTLIDIFDPKNCLTVTDIDTTRKYGAKQMARATQSLRDYMRPQHKQLVGLDEIKNINSDSLRMNYSNHCLLGSPERWLVVSEPIIQFEKITMDNIVLAHDANVSIDSIKAYFSPKLIICDGSNKKDIVATWKTDCSRLNIACFDVQMQGAYLKNY